MSSELAGIVGACDGELALGAIIDAVAQIVDADAHQLTEQVVPELRTLVRHGLLTAAPTPAAAGTRTIGATGAAG